MSDRPNGTTVSDVQQWLHGRIAERLSAVRHPTKEDVHAAMMDVLADARDRGHLARPHVDVEAIDPSGRTVRVTVRT